jgi:two-component system sensor histidine kinase YesM
VSPLSFPIDERKGEAYNLGEIRIGGAFMGARWIETIKRIITGRLRNKLIFAFSLIAAFIVVLLTYLSYRQTVIINEQNYIVNNQKIIKLVNQNLDSYVAQIDELSLSPRKDTQFMDALLSSEYLAQFYIQNQMKNMFYSREDIEEIDIYTPRNQMGYTISRSTVNLKQGIDTQTEKEAWYKEAISSPNFRSIEPAFNRSAGGKQNFLIFHRILINIADKTPLAAISITLNFHEFNRIIRDVSDNADEFIGIFNDENEPIYLSGPDYVGSSYREVLSLVKDNDGESEHSVWENGRTDVVMIDHISPVNKWKLVKLTPMDSLNKAASNARKINLLIGSGLVVFFIFVVIFVSNAITRRLKNFSRRIEQLGEGNFELDYEFKGTDEIAHLSRKFNQMVVKINDLIAERYEIKINERNARLRALEAQINPHFLYNSLQAISTEAIVNDMESIHLMVDALASSLRYCIKEGETVRVADELEHIHNYLVLQNARFGSRLNVAFEVSDDVRECLILKMSLQILLENAIEHALEQMSEPIHITIQARLLNERLILKVADDGPGIKPERLEEILSSFNDNYLEYRDEIGLKNLYSRIKLLFGSDAALTIRSEWGQGTEVTIGLPARKEVPYV